MVLFQGFFFFVILAKIHCFLKSLVSCCTLLISYKAWIYPALVYSSFLICFHLDV